MQQNQIPTVSTEQMREVDRIMVEEIGVSITMMMENASRNIAFMSQEILGGNVKNKNIVVLSGKGNNGGDGLGAARHLINQGANIVCVLTEEIDLSKDSQVQLNVLKNINANIVVYSKEKDNQIREFINSSNLIIDALLGYNLKGDPRDPYSSLIEIANDSGKKILAIDIPSGLSGDTGNPSNSTIKATTTITLALPKVGLYKKGTKKYIGNLYIADLSVPKKVYEKLRIDTPLLFDRIGVVEVT